MDILHPANPASSISPLNPANPASPLHPNNQPRDTKTEETKEKNSTEHKEQHKEKNNTEFKEQVGSPFQITIAPRDAALSSSLTLLSVGLMVIILSMFIIQIIALKFSCSRKNMSEDQ